MQFMIFGIVIILLTFPGVVIKIAPQKIHAKTLPLALKE